MIKPVPYIGEPASLPLSAIVSEQQIRTRNGFDEASLSELAASIASVGLIEPIIVRPDPATAGTEQPRYIVIAGERRLIAADMAGLAEVPVIIRDVTAEDAKIVQAIENLQRENLTLADTATGVQDLLQQYKTPSNLAKALGKSASWVSKHLSLAKLKGPVRVAMDAGVTEDAELLFSLETLRKRDSDAFAVQLEGLETGTTTRASVRDALAKAKAAQQATTQDATPDAADDENESDQAGTTTADVTPADGITLKLTGDEVTTLRLALAMYPTHGQRARSVSALMKRIESELRS